MARCLLAKRRSLISNALPESLRQGYLPALKDGVSAEERSDETKRDASCRKAPAVLAGADAP
jgi:hypothetical protein